MGRKILFFSMTAAIITPLMIIRIPFYIWLIITVKPTKLKTQHTSIRAASSLREKNP
jgi:hypothetical protein